MGAVRSAALMLHDLGHAEAGGAVEAAVERAIREHATTADLGGSLSTGEVGSTLRDLVAEAVLAE